MKDDAALWEGEVAQKWYRTTHGNGEKVFIQHSGTCVNRLYERRKERKLKITKANFSSVLSADGHQRLIKSFCHKCMNHLPTEKDIVTTRYFSGSRHGDLLMRRHHHTTRLADFIAFLDSSFPDHNNNEPL
ncbi:hypothetical protein AVEN_170540-1 [Araneus ventricosus]|uniref:Uncharacterized protein n=1 Tax=Araneus ventricosus TaxID=182803 RepID=A0A4Y2C044_ARAVE|nr:hypothetical protein AVEN_170540-1 [Araneus ventricosus]